MTSEQLYICTSCGSNHNGKFSSEISVHFKGISGLEKPTVFMFPELVVCLTCGHAEFTVPEVELRVLATNTPVENAAIVMSSDSASNQQTQPRTKVKPTTSATGKTIPPKNRSKRRR